MRSRKLKRQAQTATLRIGGVAEILPVLEHFGIDKAEVLIESGIDPKLFDDPENVITYAARDRLFKYCVARSGCQHFGLLVGQRMNLNSLGLVGLLMKTSPTTGNALRSLVDFLHIHSQGAVTTLKEDDELAILTYDALVADLQASDQTGAGAVAMMLNTMRALCGQEFRPVEASFAHRQPADIEPFRKFFRVPMYFDAEHFALVFSRNWLDTRPVGADEEIQRLLRKQIDAIKVKHSLEFPEQVRNVLRSALITGHATEKQIAALFSMTPRTLIRRMDEFDTSFHEVIDGCRFEIARQMLKNTTLNVSQISTSLGYSRSSAFIRAFRRWSGSTPAQWRETAADETAVA